jgi:hypothetical protein
MTRSLWTSTGLQDRTSGVALKLIGNVLLLGLQAMTL